MGEQAVVRQSDSASMAHSIPNESDKMLAMIERVSVMPDAKVENVERMFVLFEKMKANEARAAYTAAMVKMKPELPVIDRKGRIEIRKKDASGERTGAVQQSTAYARWEDIDEAITPVLAQHGFVLTFRSCSASDGKIVVTAVLDHEAGHRDQTETPPMQHDSTGSKNAVQAVNSTLSYGKRIAATLLLNIRTKGEDDDGKAGGDPLPINEEQTKDLIALLDDAGADKKAFCELYGIDGVALLPATKLEDAKKLIARKKAKASRK